MGKPKPKPGHTAFDSLSHQELMALLSSANHETAATLAGKLAAAAKTITEIGDDLKTRVGLVRWEGQGGDAFKEWGNQTANATLHLGTYAENAGKWLDQVSIAIAEAHSQMPPLSETTNAQNDLKSAQGNLEAAKKNPKDTDSPTVSRTAQSDATGAQARLDATRADAARQLRKLADTYVQSGTQVNRLEPPTFPPPANHLPANQWVMPQEHKALPGQAYSSQRSAGTGATASHARDDSTATPDGSNAAVPASHGKVIPDRPVDMGIDSVATLPETHTSPPGTTGNAPPVVGRSEGPDVVPRGMIPPAFGGSKTAMPSANAPGRALPSVRGLGVPGQAGINSRMPREGIVGGRPVAPNTGRPAGGIPRGTVIGSEGTTGTRGPMGRGTPGMPGMHGGGPAGGVGQSGVSGGRRLASEVGGVVGGRPQQPGQTSARPFTPGGSGLVRGANPNTAGDAVRPGQAGRAGAIPPGTHGANSRRDEQSGERPDYLSEDEETWQQGNRRVVPPIID
ncbi:hypothetical protein [Streptomyces sp. NPDC005283]|uniref:hypothetical protein n=1 Tax=Streptomyces sp. NPDC005283 TaxID=3156871 RepID=UPI003453DE5D